MLSRLSFVTAIATLALAGCVSGGYSGQYPNQPYYASNPYYGNPAPRTGYDNRSGRYFQPDRAVTCDRELKLCYDPYGPSYTATKEFLGERAANHAAKQYGNQVFFFSPDRGVVCDRRARTCSDSDGIDKRLTRQYFGNLGRVPDRYTSY